MLDKIIIQQWGDILNRKKYSLAVAESVTPGSSQAAFLQKMLVLSFMAGYCRDCLSLTIIIPKSYL